MKDLTQPRYLVIADYPDSLRKVGDIVECEYPDTNRWDGVFHLAKYPHLFRPLSWWEFRDEKEMPEYIRDGEEIVKISIWQNHLGNMIGHIEDMPNIVDLELWKGLNTEYQPATATDYENYLNQQKP